MGGYCVYDIIPNTGGGLSSQLMDTNITHAGAWVYIPIDPDEQVVELWRRYCESPLIAGFRKLRSLLVSNDDA